MLRKNEWITVQFVETYIILFASGCLNAARVHNLVSFWVFHGNVSIYNSCYWVTGWWMEYECMTDLQYNIQMATEAWRGERDQFGGKPKRSCFCIYFTLNGLLEHLHVDCSYCCVGCQSWILNIWAMFKLGDESLVS